MNATLDTLTDLEPMDDIQMLLQVATNGICEIVCNLVPPMAELLCGEGYCT